MLEPTMLNMQRIRSCIILSMNYDIPKLPEVEYVFEKLLVNIAEQNKNDEANIPYSPEGLDGIVIVSGTSVSASSVNQGNTLSTNTFTYIPYNYPQPEYLLKIHKAGENMDLAVEISPR